jgi:hypothetical protein
MMKLRPTTHDAPQPMAAGEPSADPKLEAILSQALRAPAAPSHLARRIVEQTRHHLPRKVWGISMSMVTLRRVRALAAGIVLAGSVGVLIQASGILRDAKYTLEARENITALSRYQAPQTELDQEIHQLAMHIDAAGTLSQQRDVATSQAVYALDTLFPPTGGNMGYHDDLF